MPHLIPFTIGRKNYLFCESVNGAKASAIIYSIVETAKANGLNVYKYLEYPITELSERKKDGSLDYIVDLLPWAKTPQRECKVPNKKSSVFFQCTIYQNISRKHAAMRVFVILFTHV